MIGMPYIIDKKSCAEDAEQGKERRKRKKLFQFSMEGGRWLPHVFARIWKIGNWEKNCWLNNLFPTSSKICSLIFPVYGNTLHPQTSSGSGQMLPNYIQTRVEKNTAIFHCIHRIRSNFQHTNYLFPFIKNMLITMPQWLRFPPHVWCYALPSCGLLLLWTCFHIWDILTWNEEYQPEFNSFVNENETYFFPSWILSVWILRS